MFDLQCAAERIKTVAETLFDIKNGYMNCRDDEHEEVLTSILLNQLQADAAALAGYVCMEPAR